MIVFVYLTTQLNVETENILTEYNILHLRQLNSSLVNTALYMYILYVDALLSGTTTLL